MLGGQAAASDFLPGGPLLGGHPGLVLRASAVGDSVKGKKEEARTHSARPRHSLGAGGPARV